MARIAYIDTAGADARVRSIFEDYERRTGTVPNLVRALAHNPELLQALTPTFRRLFGASSLPPALKAMVMLHVSKVNWCPYCWQDHAPTLARLGYSAEQIEALGEALPTEDMYSDLERAVLAFADEVTREIGASRRTYERVAQLLSDAQMVELTVLVGVCNVVTRLVRTFDLEPNH